MRPSLHNTPELKAARLARICNDWNITVTTLHQFFGEDICQEDWFSRSLQAWCLESNALSFVEDSARFKDNRRQRRPTTTEEPIRDWSASDIDSCLNKLLTERIRLGHGWQHFPTCLPESLKFKKGARLRDHVPLLQGYEHLSSICDYDTALSLLLSRFDTGNSAHPEREDSFLGGHPARTISSTQLTSRMVLGEVANPLSGVASPHTKVAVGPNKFQCHRYRTIAKAASQSFKVASENVWNVIEALEGQTQALVHGRNPRGLPVTKLINDYQSKYFRMIRSCPGWETYSESIVRSWGSPLSQAAMIRLLRLAQISTSAEAEPMLQQQLESQPQKGRLSVLSIEAVRQMMRPGIISNMSTREHGSLTTARARINSPDPEKTESERDSVLSGNNGFLDDFTPDAGAGLGNTHVQPNSSTSEGARGVPNSVSQVNHTEELEYEAVAELVDYFDFMTADPFSPGQLYYQGQTYEAAQSAVYGESGLISQEESMERPEVVTPSRKRERADSATQLDSCKRHNASSDPTNPGQLRYQGQLHDSSRSGEYDEFGSNLQKELMEHRERGRVDSATQIDSYLHHNVFEQFPDLGLDSMTTPRCPAAGLKTRHFDTLPIYNDSSSADHSLVLELAQCNGGQRDLDAWMGIF